MSDIGSAFIVLAQAIPGLDEVVKTFLANGVTGAIAVVTGIAYVRKDIALQTISAARVVDAKEIVQIVAENTKTQAILIQTIQNLATIIQNSKLAR